MLLGSDIFALNLTNSPQFTEYDNRCYYLKSFIRNVSCISSYANILEEFRERPNDIMQYSALTTSLVVSYFTDICSHIRSSLFHSNEGLTNISCLNLDGVMHQHKSELFL